jgi:hypothetical protein
MFSGGEMLRMCGASALRRCGMQSLEQRKVPRVLTWCMRSKRFIGVAAVLVSMMALALLIRMSIPPKVSTALSTAAWTSSSCRMSTTQGRAFPPAASISAAAV